MTPPDRGDPESKVLRNLEVVCGLPRRFAALDLDGMGADGDEDYEAALARVRELGQALRAGEKPRDSLLLAGRFGTGKTRCACWLLAQCYRGSRQPLPDTKPPGFGGLSPIFLPAKRLKDYRFAGPLDGADPLVHDRTRRRILGSPLLVIDDLNRVSAVRGELEFVEEVLEARWNAELATIATASSPPAELDPRVGDLLAPWEVLHFVGKSRRAAS